MNKHTPGPWEVELGIIRGGQYRFIADCSMISFEGNYDSKENEKQREITSANVRLIAAAPEMYDLLKMYSEHPVEGSAFDNMVDSLLGRIEGNE